MTLQTRSKKPIKKPLLISLIVLALVLLGGYTAYAYSSNSWPFTPKTHNQSDTNQTITPNTQKNTTKSDTSSSSDPAGTDKTPTQSSPPKSGTQASSTDLTGVVNYKEVSGGNLVIRNTINQSVSSGSCTLTLTDSSGHIVTRTANIVANPSSSTCEGFSVPTSQLHSGNWNISISLKSGDKQGTIRSSVAL